MDVVGVDGMGLAHRDAEVKVVKLDNRSSPSVALMGIVGSAATVRVHHWSRTASQSSPKCCIAMESALDLTAQDGAEPGDWGTTPLNMAQPHR